MLTGLTGCLSPIAMHRAVIEYDRTVSYVEADLLLLNIARARYHRPVHFTAVSSVAATFDFRTSAGISGGVGRAVDPDRRPLNLEYSASVAENPTITIVPITGEEFTKRVLRPLDEDKFEFLVRQGYDINMVLRLMARGIAIDDVRGPLVLFNQPSQAEGYREFRRRLLHLAGLDAERKLFVGPILFEESQTVRTNRPPNPDEVVAALEKGFRWEGDSEGKVHTVRRKAVGRLLIANYDPARLSNEERRGAARGGPASAVRLRVGRYQAGPSRGRLSSARFDSASQHERDYRIRGAEYRGGAGDDGVARSTDPDCGAQSGQDTGDRRVRLEAGRL